MSEKESLHGLACPNCGGMVSIPEGVAVIRCPYCDMRSLVRGERGLRRYQIPQRVERAKAETAMKGFLSSSQAIAGDADKSSEIAEAFVAYLPFWVSWARVLGWIFGEEKVGSGDDAHYEPREVKIAEEMSWNGAACDVGEFGVEQLALTDQPMEPFDAEGLHAQGMVFEPVGSLSEAKSASESDFQERVNRMADLDRIAQSFIRFTRRRMGLVYYPMWVLRYFYKGRAFQVVVDGFSGKVLYGKAPGSTLYRAAVLVGGMALGAFLAVDGPALVLWLGGRDSGDDSTGYFIFALALLAAGFGLMLRAYRKFRYGEQYEYRDGEVKRRRFQRRKEKGVYRVRERTA